MIELLEPKGLGALQLAFEQLKDAPAGRRALRAGAQARSCRSFPQKIGIVTSTSGAAIRDMLRVIGRRFGELHIVIAPCRVQGEGAAEEIAQGLRDLNALGGVDIIIVGRGGGSLEDLWAFNEEAVARAIAASKVPVVSAVGHEVDFTIADFVADLRAPTPSAAAELVVREKQAVVESLVQLRARLERFAARPLRDLERRVDELTTRTPPRGARRSSAAPAIASCWRPARSAPLTRWRESPATGTGWRICSRDWSRRSRGGATAPATVSGPPSGGSIRCRRWRCSAAATA